VGLQASAVVFPAAEAGLSTIKMQRHTTLCFILLCVLSVHKAIAEADVPDGYSLDDPNFDHTDVAIAHDEAGDMQSALRSFRAAAKVNLLAILQ
jgi:hypothetical protein